MDDLWQTGTHGQFSIRFLFLAHDTRSFSLGAREGPLSRGSCANSPLTIGGCQIFVFSFAS